MGTVVVQQEVMISRLQENNNNLKKELKEQREAEFKSLQELEASFERVGEVLNGVDRWKGTAREFMIKTKEGRRRWEKMEKKEPNYRLLLAKGVRITSLEGSEDMRREEEDMGKEEGGEGRGDQGSKRKRLDNDDGHEECIQVCDFVDRRFWKLIHTFYLYFRLPFPILHSTSRTLQLDFSGDMTLNGSVGCSDDDGAGLNGSNEFNNRDRDGLGPNISFNYLLPTSSSSSSSSATSNSSSPTSSGLLSMIAHLRLAHFPFIPLHTTNVDIAHHLPAGVSSATPFIQEAVILTVLSRLDRGLHFSQAVGAEEDGRSNGEGNTDIRMGVKEVEER
jgi:hypothetical protein